MINWQNTKFMGIGRGTGDSFSKLSGRKSGNNKVGNPSERTSVCQKNLLCVGFIQFDVTEEIIGE
jgi:hypothetical protein